MARPKIDRAQAHRHTAILDDSTDRFIFAAFPDLKGCRSNPWQRSGRFADLVEEMENLQAQRYGIFVAVHAFHGDKRRKAEIKRNRALWCERDQPGLRLPLAPSLRIRTSPGRGHDYLLTDSNDPPTSAEADTMNHVIVDQYGGDPNACDGARVLRLAGTWNLKADPFPVEIIGGSGEVYSRRTLLAAFPVPVGPPVVPFRAVKLAAGRDDDQSRRQSRRHAAYALVALNERCRELAAKPSDSGRNAATFRLACYLGKYAHHGLIPAATLIDAVVAACAANGLIKETGRKAVIATIHQGLKRAHGDALPVLEDRPIRRAA